MSLSNLPGMTQTTRDFIQAVRIYTRDHPQLNRILKGEESSDRMIAWALVDALSDFNGTPPLSGWSLEDLLSRGQMHLLLRMTVVNLIESVGLLQTRNHVNYSDGGWNGGSNDKTPLLMNWLQYFKGMVEQKKTRVKVAMNIESIIGPGNVGLFSELWAVNSSYGSY